MSSNYLKKVVVIVIFTPLMAGCNPALDVIEDKRRTKPFPLIYPQRAIKTNHVKKP